MLPIIVSLVTAVLVLLLGGSAAEPPSSLSCDLSGVVEVYSASSRGTGFATDLGLVTVAHLTKSSDDGFVVVAPQSGNPFRAAILWEDQDLDLAVVELPLDLAPLPLQSGPTPRPGTPITVVGYPMFVSGVPAWSVGSIVWRDDSEILLSATINPGNSGSPVLTNSCEVVGVVNALYRSPMPLGRAVPIEFLEEFHAPLR